MILNLHYTNFIITRKKSPPTYLVFNRKDNGSFLSEYGNNNEIAKYTNKKRYNIPHYGTTKAK